MAHPEVSILMAVYNAAPFLDEAIGSVVSQSYGEWELICVNDGSTDNSLELLRTYEQQDPRIKVIDQPNAGAANARNTALKVSKGRYVCILDADDKLSRDYLQKTLHVALQDVENDCVIPEMYVWNWQDESKSYSCNDLFCVPEPCDGRLALERSIPWRLHALALWNGDMMRGVGYRTDGYITSDEVSSRDFFAHCRHVVPSGGRYYYRYNEESITKKISPRPIEKLQTNIQLRELVVQYGLSQQEQTRITTDHFFELIAWAIYFLRNKHLFLPSERKKSLGIIKQAYRLRAISMVQPSDRGNQLKKLVLGYNYALFMAVCRVVCLLKK